MNLRPSGYEPDELPGCSTPRGCVCSLGWKIPGLEDLAATYSPASWDAVPWALGFFTAEFGMGSGGGTPPWPPGRPAQGGRGGLPWSERSRFWIVMCLVEGWPVLAVIWCG